MDSQNNLKFIIYFNLYSDRRKNWHMSNNKFSDGDKSFNDNDSYPCLPITEDTGFLIKHPKNYNIYGLDNFVKISSYYFNENNVRIPGVIYKAHVQDDIYPLKIEDSDNNIIKIIYLCVGSKYFPLNSTDRRYMIKYLESFDKNLVISKNKNNFKFSDTLYDTSLRFNYLSMFNLIREYSNIIISYHDFILHPNFYLLKKYSRFSSLKNIDNKSMQIDIVRPGIGRTSFIRDASYDQEDNRWIKYISLRIIQLANESISKIKLRNDWANSLRKRYLHKLFIVRDYLIYINQNTFLKNINYHISYLPSKLWESYRYSSIYREYINLFNNHLGIDYYINKRYSHSIKQTYDIYELWTYVWVLRRFIANGFKIKGLKYKKNNVDLLYLILHGFHKGYHFILVKNNIILDVIYNVSIDNNDDSPIYMFNSYITNIADLKNNQNGNIDSNFGIHDKPDIRIDIIGKSKKEYYGSLFLDAKCKSKQSVNNGARDACQLLYYKNNARYKEYILDGYDYYLGDINPVQSVYVLSPDKYTQNNYNIPGIKYFTLFPNKDSNSFNTFINDIHKCIKIKKIYDHELNNVKLSNRFKGYK